MNVNSLISFKYFKSKVLLYSFLFTSTLQASSVDKLLEQAFNKNLQQSHIWRNLLHINNNKASIYNSNFLLSYPNFTLKKEFSKTLKSFFNRNKLDDTHTICKYPARYLWIKNNLNLTDSDFPKVNCKSLKKYKALTSSEHINLVFVSENINSPSSMMGHVFFKISGKNKKNHITNNSVSFFTVINSINLPSLMVKSLLTGMQGYFILKPFHKDIDRYLKKENRNLWEYELELNKETRELIYLHFWELKDINIKYLFTGFNCATIVSNMLAISSKKYAKQSRLWLTPKDVIKDSKKYGLIKSTHFSPAEDWYLKMLYEELGTDGKKIINQLNNIDNKKIENITFTKDLKKALLEKQLLYHYSKREYEENHLDTKLFNKIKTLYNKKDDEYNLDFSNYKNPIKTSDDTQLTLSYYRDKKHQKNYTQIKFLPASNYLHDNNREYFGETELKIAQLDLLVNNSKIKINEFNLYSMKSIVPWDPWTNDSSSEFKINYEQHYNAKGNYGAYNISGGLGYSKKFGNDFYLYSLLNMGLGYEKNHLYPYTFLDNGILFYEVFNMKTTINHQYIYNQDSSHKAYNKFKLQQSLFLNKNFNLELKADYQTALENPELNYGFGISYFF